MSLLLLLLLLWPPACSSLLSRDINAAANASLLKLSSRLKRSRDCALLSSRKQLLLLVNSMWCCESREGSGGRNEDVEDFPIVADDKDGNNSNTVLLLADLLWPIVVPALLRVLNSLNVFNVPMIDCLLHDSPCSTR
ncbi:hypothetical protein SAMD00019534_002630, partial [Acytostelium subglobosum LB1]|uniref:hypothetical protein n=1 Tax=Acytostelium subglobosum LB1 TaxID=1410327 RepID=UPI000644A2B6